ncbi:PIG-L deacetylase family protein [Dactylosporangium sp. NPDC051485]|uniref:PIG-L deacetylase family protein n=1 Tax=Dactylosporangium sp. NPDC051485 TaxID=3154846 RepID=UPI00344905E0
MIRVLILATHPNDEIIGAGGSLAHHTDAGDEVTIAHITDGERGGSDSDPEALRGRRNREAVAAAAAVGVPADRVRFLRLPDGGIDPYDVEQFMTVLTELRASRPELLYVPHPHDGAFDHEAAFALAWRAAGMSGSSNFGNCGPAHWVPTVLGYEVWQPIRSPAFLRDVTPYTDRKITALTCYESQSPAVKGAGQSSQVGTGGTALSAWRGVTTTGGFREAFDVLRLGALP